MLVHQRVTCGISELERVCQIIYDWRNSPERRLPQPLGVFLATNHLRIQNRMQDTLGCFFTSRSFVSPQHQWSGSLAFDCAGSCWYPNGVDNHWSGAPKPTDIAYLGRYLGGSKQDESLAQHRYPQESTWGCPIWKPKWWRTVRPRNRRDSVNFCWHQVVEESGLMKVYPWRCHLVQFDSSNECHPVNFGGMIRDVSRQTLAVSCCFRRHMRTTPSSAPAANETSVTISRTERRLWRSALKRVGPVDRVDHAAGCIKIELE